MNVLPKEILEKMESKGIYYIKIAQKINVKDINNQYTSQAVYLEDERFYISGEDNQEKLCNKVNYLFL